MADCRLMEMQSVEYFLDLLGPDENADFKGHVKACAACQALVKGVRADFQALARWPDLTPSREAMRGLLRAVHPDDAAEVDDAMDVVLPGDEGAESAALAASAAPSPAAPGLLLGPTLSEDERRHILAEMGFDASGRPRPAAPVRPAARSGRGDVALDELSRRADEAAARVSGRLSKSQAEDAWKRAAGTTVISTAGTPAPPAGAAAAVPEAPPPKRSDRFEALAGTTQLGDAGIPPGVAEILLDDADDETAALMGTTILSAAAPGAPVARYQSRVLQKIKSEDPRARALKRAAGRTARRTPAWMFSIGMHVAVLLLLGLFVIAMPEEAPPPPLFRMLEAPKEPEPEPVLPPPEELEQIQEIDPTQAPAEATSDEPEESDVRKTEAIAAGGDKTKAAREVEPFREPRESRSGQGRGGGGGGGVLKAVEAGLAWLAAHQTLDGDESGAFEWRNHTARCAQHAAPACPHGVTETKERNFTPGLTGLATLSFLASAYHHVEPAADARAEYRLRHARYRQTVARALAYLRRHQDPDGAIGRKVRGREDPVNEDSEGYMYNHVIATLALCDAYALTKDPDLKAPCEKALAWLGAAQDPRGGWDYYAASALAPDEAKLERSQQYRVDLSITGWAVMALKVAQIGGLKVDPAVRSRVRTFVEHMERGTKAEPRYAEGYFKGYEPADLQRALGEVREAGDQAREAELLQIERTGEPRRGVAMVAVAALAKMYLGTPPSNTKVRSQLQYLVDHPPSVAQLRRRVPGALGHDHTYYYWYYGTLACWNAEDTIWHAWWDDHAEKALLSLQAPAGSPAAGSFDPEPDTGYGAYAGRLYATSLALLSLETFYRYAPLYREKAANLARPARPAAAIAAEMRALLPRLADPAAALDAGPDVEVAMADLVEQHPDDPVTAPAIAAVARLDPVRAPAGADGDALARYAKAERMVKRLADAALTRLGKLRRPALDELVGMLREGIGDPARCTKVLAEVGRLALYADGQTRRLVENVAVDSGDAQVRQVGARVVVQLERADAAKRRAQRARETPADPAAAAPPASR